VNYGQRFGDNADWYVNASLQHVGNRYTQPGDQERFNEVFIVGANGMAFFDPITGDAGQENFDWGSLRLPSYNLVNLSAGIGWDNGLEVSVYANNIFDENAHLSFDRERGGRARQGFNIGTPRTVGVTTRIKFGH